MAKQSMKQEIMQSIVNSQLQKAIQENQQEQIANLKADFDSWQKQQMNPEALQADFANWQQSQAQTKQAAQIPSLADTQPKRDLQAEAREYFANVRKERAAQAVEEKKRIEAEKQQQIKAAREDYQRQQQEEQMLAEKKYNADDLERQIANSDKAVPQKTKKLSKEQQALEEQILNADKYNVPEKKEEKKYSANPFMSDYLSVRTANDLGKDRKAIQTSEVIKKYAEAKGISEDQARAEFEKAEAMKGQSISTLGERDLASLEATDQAKKDLQVANWLDPNKKLSKNEKKDAREFAQAELNKFEYNSSHQPILRTDEERQRYAEMVNLLNKTSGVANTMTGVIQQPLNLARAVRDVGSATANELTGLGAALSDKAGLTEGATQRHNEQAAAKDALYAQNDASMDLAYQNALKQNPVLTKGGEFAGNMGMYALTNPVFDSLGAAAGLGKVGSYALNQVGQNLQDLALDTLPTLNKYMDDGTLSDQEKMSLLIGGAFNASGNIFMPVLMNGAAKLYQGIDADRVAREAADEAFLANVREGADKLAKLANPEDAKKIAAREAFANAPRHKVGKVTTIIGDYDGPVPEKVSSNTNIVPIEGKYFDEAITNIEDAKLKETDKQKKNTILGKIYKTLFGKSNQKIETVNGLMFDGDPYSVTVNKNVVGKIMSDGEITPEKLAVLQDIEKVIKDADYVGTAPKFDYKGNGGKPDVVRYDYFETPINIKGKDYIVSFDVEVYPYQNKYRTHRVIDELNLTPATGEGLTSPEVHALSNNSGNLPGANKGVSGFSSDSNITDAIENVNKETINNVSQLSAETNDLMANDFMDIYNAMNPDYDTVAKLNNEKVTTAFENLQEKLSDYEKASFGADDIDEVITAKKAVNAARKRLERAVKAVDPEVKLESTKYKMGELVGKPEFRRTEILPPDEAEVDELVNDWINNENPNKWVRDAEPDTDIYPNKVMAESADFSNPEKIESFKIEEEVPTTKVSKPEIANPESDDYVSKFRTHNEQNFNMTDEELNNKYFNTQNENFHFLKGDRAADLENATKNLENDYDGTVNKLLTKPTDTQFTPQEVDEGFMAWNKELQAARETGDYGKSADIMYRMTRDAHDKGAGLQAYAAWKKNSPAGVVLDANESARKMAVDQFGSNYIKELDSLTDKIDDICKSGDSLEDKIKQIDDLMKDAQSKGYKNGISGLEQMEDLLKSGSKIDVSHIHDILFEANKVPNLSAQSQAEIAQLASEMYGRELTNAEKRQYINQINMILSREKNWSIKDKAVELSHILMLSGSRTHLKNFVANVGMLPQEALARKISALGQNAYHLIDPNYKPTQAFFVGEDAKKLATEMYEAKGGADAIVEDIADKYTNQLADRIGATYMFGTGKKNIASKANDAAQNLIPGLKKAEDQFADMANKALKKMGAEGAYDAMDANVSLLENYRQFIYGSLSGLEDNPFVKKNFIDRLASYIQAQDIKSMNDIPEEALDIARAEALKATFKDDNAITALVQSLKNVPVIGELLFPFTKTPANLLARSIDFSPIGLARSLYGAVNKNSRFAKDTIGETIDEIAKGTGGTLTMLLGMYLYANGLITGKKSDDPDIANYMANEGWQQYSISSKGVADFINKYLGTDIDLGDNYYDFSFLQPSTTNMIAAEEVWDELMDGKKISEKKIDDIFNRVKSVAGSYTDALLAQSTLQNVGELFGSQYSDDGVGGNLIQNALEYPTRFTSGAISDLAKLNDDTKREYYSKNKPIETVKNAIVSKLPGLSKTLPAKYDAFGNELSRNESEGKKWLNTLLNPSTTTHRNDDPLYDYVDSLNEESASGDYVPSKTLRKIKLDDETELSLDNKQYSEASRVAGEMRKSILEDIQKSDLYNSLDADDRVAILDNLEKVATNSGYLSIADNAKVTQEAQKIMDMYKDGGVDAVVKDYVGKKIVKDSGISSNSKAAEEVKAAVAEGNVEKGNQIANAETEMKTAITNAGLEVNDTTKAIYQSDGDKGIKTWSSMNSKGLTDKRAYDVYQSAINSSDPIPSLDKWISTYKSIDGLVKSNGHVDQKEFKAYLSKGNYSIAEAEQLARIYGDWTTTPFINKKGQWSFH